MGDLRWLGPLALICGALLSGCNGDAALEAQRRELEREHQIRMEELSALEIRLLSLAATRREWLELGNRHEAVSEIACERAVKHLEGMDRHYIWQEERARRLQAQRRLEDAAAKLSRVSYRASGQRSSHSNN